jgi:hypothetical protein
MAKIRRCKLFWAASEADDVTGYRIYWANGATVGYDDNYIDVGAVTEIQVPERITHVGGPVMFGITALDRDGHESDMTTIAEPFQVDIPKAPQRLRLSTADEYLIVEAPEADVIEPEIIRSLVEQLEAGGDADTFDEHDYASEEQTKEAPARFDIGSIF